MAVNYYIDFINGDDSKDGSSWANAKKTVNQNVPNDVTDVYVAKTSDILSLGQMEWTEVNKDQLISATLSNYSMGNMAITNSKIVSSDRVFTATAEVLSYINEDEWYVMNHNYTNNNSTRGYVKIKEKKSTTEFTIYGTDNSGSQVNGGTIGMAAGNIIKFPSGNSLYKDITPKDLVWTYTNGASLKNQTSLSPNIYKYTWGPQKTNVLANEKLAYYEFPSALDLSSFTKISFYVINGSSFVNGARICLCSDSSGDVIVDEFSFKPTDVLNNSIYLEREGGGSLGSSIKTIAIYSDKNLGSTGTSILLFSNIVATNHFHHNCFITDSNDKDSDHPIFEVGYLHDEFIALRNCTVSYIEQTTNSQLPLLWQAGAIKSTYYYDNLIAMSTPFPILSYAPSSNTFINPLNVHFGVDPEGVADGAVILQGTGYLAISISSYINTYGHLSLVYGNVDIFSTGKEDYVGTIKINSIIRSRYIRPGYNTNHRNERLICNVIYYNVIKGGDSKFGIFTESTASFFSENIDYKNINIKRVIGAQGLYSMIGTTERINMMNFNLFIENIYNMYTLIYPNNNSIYDQYTINIGNIENIHSVIYAQDTHQLDLDINIDSLKYCKYLINFQTVDRGSLKAYFNIKDTQYLYNIYNGSGNNNDLNNKIVIDFNNSMSNISSSLVFPRKTVIYNFPTAMTIMLPTAISRFYFPSLLFYNMDGDLTNHVLYMNSEDRMTSDTNLVYDSEEYSWKVKLILNSLFKLKLGSVYAAKNSKINIKLRYYFSENNIEHTPYLYILRGRDFDFHSKEFFNFDNLLKDQWNEYSIEVTADETGVFNIYLNTGGAPHNTPNSYFWISNLEVTQL